MKLIDLINTESVDELVEDGVRGYRSLINYFGKDYIMRRNVGFTIGQSVKGSIKDTRKYCFDIFSGKEPVEMKEAISFK